MKDLVRSAKRICDEYHRQNAALAKAAFAEIVRMVASQHLELEEDGEALHAIVVAAQAIIDDRDRDVISTEEAMVQLGEVFETTSQI